MNEVEHLITEIRRHHASRGRKIARYFRRPLSEASGAKLLAQTRIPLPVEWRQLYAAYNGVDPGDALSLRAGTVFFDWPWESLGTLVDMNDIVLRHLGEDELGQLYFGIGQGVPWIGIDLGKAQGADVPVIVGRPQRPTAIAFDSLTAMLRTMHAALVREVVAYDAEQAIVYDIPRMVPLVREFNSRDEYWCMRWAKEPT